MKKITLLAGLLISTLFASAQVFWTETWSGTTCSQGCTTYTGPNGTWTTAASGRNGSASNLWYYSYQEQGMGRGKCGTGTGTLASAHVGSVAASPILSFACPSGDCGAINDDFYGSPSTETNTMIQSPVINCTGKTSILLSFNYILQGAVGHDSASVWYFDGSKWSVLVNPPSTINTSCSGQGLWTHFSIALPASANNNSKVQVGFNWKNDTLGTADLADPNDYPSVAVDSIQLSTAPSGVNEVYNNASISIYPNPNNGVFSVNCEQLTGRSIMEVFNVLGEKVYTCSLNASTNQINLSGKASGVYIYKVINEIGTVLKQGKLVIQ